MYNKYLELREKIIKQFFLKMNPEQFQAINNIAGPLLILAGAGSGKTTVMVNKIANLLKFGSGLTKSEVNCLSPEDYNFLENYSHDKDYMNPLATNLIFCNIPNPWNILSITFTNKAANELKTRLIDMLGENIASNINASTFHSACMKILRKDIDKLGYNRNFTIYDSDDSKKIIVNIIENMNLDTKLFPIKSVLSKISSAKSNLISPEQMLLSSETSDYQFITTANIYSIYQTELMKSNALDFDDIIKLTVDLFLAHPEILKYYQNKFKYIMVDEFQDTNHAQFKLIYLLAQKHNNICVVGDDDQSIYKFRGATIENILNFEQFFKDTSVIRLEQNYRCTKTILDAANAVISKNFARKNKTLWTNNPSGMPISIYTSINEYGEAKFVVDTILHNIQNGCKYSDNAILYRTNFQSNIIEQYLVKSGIPYKIIGGLRFYERKEIKDIIAYLSLINNTSDNLRLRRIINEPKRGIGDTTIKNAQIIAEENGISLFNVIANNTKYPTLSKKSNTLTSFVSLINDLVNDTKNLSLPELAHSVLQKTGYLKYLEVLGNEGSSRIDNINQLITNIQKYSESVENPSLSGFLEEIALYADPDSVEKSDSSQVFLMTLHSAKGLEFPHVMIIGMEEGIFPGNQVMYNNKELEEERRLAYVGFTRAKEQLYLIYAKERKYFNKTLIGSPSKFINEIPKQLCNFISQDYPSDFKNIDKYKSNILRDKIKNTNTMKTIGIGSYPNISQSNSNSIHIHQCFDKGACVKHKVFGTGTIIKSTPIANDTLLEINFEKVGFKKIMANFAGIIVCD